MKADRTLLEAALVGYQAQIAEIQEAMAGIRSQLGHTSGPASSPVTRAKRKLSASSRKRMAAAQKKRWAEYRKNKTAAA
jgi:hypothetical protein